MLGHRLVYLAALAGAGIFYIAYGEWASWLILLLVVLVPWLSLAVSIPAIVTFRGEADGPDALEMGQEGDVWLVGSCPLPMPPFRGKLGMQFCLTGVRRRCPGAAALPTDHCGGVLVTAARVRVCDYLGLFAFPARVKAGKLVRVLPRQVPIRHLPDLEAYLARAWRPKPGGGFSENHELRLYRPGDSLNQIHWKLTAKTGKLTIREPMEPQRGLVLLTMTLRGEPEAMDRKFGRLKWLGQYLLEKQVPFEIRALTGEGVVSFPVAGDRALSKAIDALLCAPAAAEGSLRDQCFAASWRFHIGGDADEG